MYRMPIFYSVSKNKQLLLIFSSFEKYLSAIPVCRTEGQFMSLKMKNVRKLPLRHIQLRHAHFVMEL